VGYFKRRFKTHIIATKIPASIEEFIITFNLSAVIGNKK